VTVFFFFFLFLNKEKSHIIGCRKFFFSVQLSIYIPNVHIIATIRNEVAYFKNTCIASNTSSHLYETDTDCVYRQTTQNYADTDVKQEQTVF